MEIIIQWARPILRLIVQGFMSHFYVRFITYMTIVLFNIPFLKDFVSMMFVGEVLWYMIGGLVGGGGDDDDDDGIKGSAQQQIGKMRRGIRRAK